MTQDETDEKPSLLGWIPESTKDKAIMVFIMAAIGGVSGSGLWRVDRFTGTDGREIDKRIIELEHDFKELKADQTRDSSKLANLPPRQIDLNANQIDNLDERIRHIDARVQWLVDRMIDKKVER